MIKHGATIIRLDAFAYAIKKLDTNDFFVEPEIWELLDEVQAIVAKKGAVILPEIHEHYTIQRKLTQHDYFTYDFALPMVVLYTLYSQDATRLVEWLSDSPMKQFTTLDTHDGIGVVDVKDILTDEEIELTTNKLYEIGANVKRKYSTAEYNDDDKKYFISRLIQAFAPGIPQVYYVGLLAGKNDIELLEKTKEGRNINRHYYSNEEIAREVKRPVVVALLKLFTYRNRSKAFELDGKFEITTSAKNSFNIKRTSADGQTVSELKVDLATYSYEVKENGQKITF